MKERLLNIIPECYVDTNLIEYLVNAKVNHQHSCTKVIGLLNTKFKDQFAIGIIDRDKFEMGYIRECSEIAATPHLSLMKHKIRNQYLITIRPAVDGFILDCAAQESIDPAEYDLPAKLKEFTKVSKAVTSNTDTRFKSLFRSLMNNREFRNLKNSLDYMVQSKYQTDINTLKHCFEAP